jgi:hypothetical protein
VIRFARHEPPRNGQRARQSGDTPNLVHPQFPELVDYISHVVCEKKHNRVSRLPRSAAIVVAPTSGATPSLALFKPPVLLFQAPASAKRRS